MIYRKFGTSYQTVDPAFDSKALNEVNFRRNRADAIPVVAFEEGWVRQSVHELDAEAEGDVQDETEQLLLDRLEAKLRELIDTLDAGAVVVIENDPGHDYPKTRQKISNVVVEWENRLRFAYSVSPPLRVGVYRPKG